MLVPRKGIRTALISWMDIGNIGIFLSVFLVLLYYADDGEFCDKVTY